MKKSIKIFSAFLFFSVFAFNASARNCCTSSNNSWKVTVRGDITTANACKAARTILAQL